LAKYKKAMPTKIITCHPYDIDSRYWQMTTSPATIAEYRLPSISESLAGLLMLVAAYVVKTYKCPPALKPESAIA
jgi:hypothetical protein